MSRRSPRYHQFTDAAKRRLAIIRIHAEGWTVTSIAEDLETTRPRIHEVLRRWVDDRVLRFEDRAHRANYSRWTVDVRTMNEVRQLQENLDLDETLVLEFSDEPLAQYSVLYEPDRRHLPDIVSRQLFETRYRLLQLTLWPFDDGEWPQVQRVPTDSRRVKRTSSRRQLSFCFRILRLPERRTV